MKGRSFPWAHGGRGAAEAAPMQASTRSIRRRARP